MNDPFYETHNEREVKKAFSETVKLLPPTLQHDEKLYFLFIGLVSFKNYAPCMKKLYTAELKQNCINGIKICTKWNDLHLNIYFYIFYKMMSNVT